MYGYIFDIKKFAIHDGPGIRTSIFMKGCPLNCLWCHNPESIRVLPDNNCEEEIAFLTKKYSLEELMEAIKKDTLFYDESGGGVTFSGGEPMLQADFLSDILELCKRNNISTTIDTSGYVPRESFDMVYRNTDLFLYDLKLFDNELHKKYTGVSNNLILENLEYLNFLGCKLIIRIPLIPGITDTEVNITSLGVFLRELNFSQTVELLPYNELAKAKYRRLKRKSELGNLKTQSKQKLEEIKNLLFSYELKVKLN